MPALWDLSLPQVRALLAALGQAGGGGGGDEESDGGDADGPAWERMFDRTTLLFCGAAVGACVLALGALALGARVRGGGGGGVRR